MLIVYDLAVRYPFILYRLYRIWPHQYNDTLPHYNDSISEGDKFTVLLPAHRCDLTETDTLGALNTYLGHIKNPSSQ